LEDYESTLPEPASFEGSAAEMPFIIFGDEAYPLKTYFMKPSAERICHVKNLSLIVGCREQGDLLSMPLLT
jgi:hypothetical protein